MDLERFHLSSIEKELLFVSWCNKRGIKQFLFDLDDTICSTRQIFREVMSRVYDFLATNAPVISREQWKAEVEATNNRLFEQIGVNPIRWNHVVDEAAEKYSLDNRIKQETKLIFQEIYTTPLNFLEGAEKGLDFINRAGMPIGVVTHAGSEWTWKKYNWLNLKRFVNWDGVFIVDENKHKTPQSWIEAISYFGLNPKQYAVVGDSPRTDINAAKEAGVRECFLVEDPQQWSVHNQPVDADVRRISNLAQLIFLS